MNLRGRSLLIAILAAGLFVAAAGPASGEFYRLTDRAGSTGMVLRSADPNGVEVAFGLEWFQTDPLTVDGETLQTITIPGVLLPNNAGAPNLPGTGRYIALPRGATATVEVVSAQTRTFPNIAVAPAAPIQKENDDSPPVYAKDPAIYGRNALYPQSAVTLSAPTRMRGVDVVVLGITPFQYNPVTRELLVYTELTVRVTFQGGNGQYGESRLRSRYWEPLLANHLLNYASLPPVDFNAPRGARNGYEYVIICPDDPSFIAWADTLKAWRTLQGITTEVFTTTDIGGTTATVIENWLNNAYNTWDPAPSAFLLLGDYPNSGEGRDTGITSPIYDSYCASDNIYADVDGDQLPDMAHARITARNASDLQTMIGKMLSYERQPYTDPAFYAHPIIAGGWQTERWFILCTEVCLGYLQNEQGKSCTREYAIYSGTPGTQWSSNQNTSMVVSYFGPNGLGYIPATPAGLTDWGGNPTRINNDINAGSFMLLHRDHGAEDGWGEPAYNSTSLDGLHNTKYPFVFSINCLTGKYNWTSQSFSEKFHRMGYGALGVTAATEVSYSFVNDAFVWGMWDSMWPDFDPNYGGSSPTINDLRPSFAQTYGKYYLQASSWPYNPGDKEVTYHLFHHHGDAFITMYTQVPQTMPVTHDDVLLTDTESFTVQAPAGALIALTVGGEIIGVAAANGMPQAIAVTPQTEPGELRITITKANYFRYDQSVPIIPPNGPYVVIADDAIDDDLAGGSLGDADAKADAGETVELILSLRNAGNYDATNVRATLSCADPLVTITDNYETFGTLRPGQTRACEEDYDIAVSPDCADGQTLAFTANIESDNRLVWVKQFALTVEAPVMGFVSYTLDDTAGGDGDGRADPGETIAILPRLGNTGSEDATNLMVTLNVSHPSVTIVQGQSTLALLPAGQQAALATPFEIQIASTCPNPEILSAGFAISADWGQHAAGDFEIPVGGFFDNVEAGAGTWTTAVVSPGFINQWHRSSTRNYTPGGLWSWKFGDAGSGNYANLADGVLVTEPLTLRDTCVLRFRHWMASEVSSAYPDHCYDGGRVEMSNNGGPWTPITPVGGYPYLVRAGGTPGPFPAETPVYAGSINWAEALFEVNDLTGTVQFRFRFGSDGATALEGWYIDDVEFIGSGSDPSATDEVVPVRLYPEIAQNQPNPFHPATTIRFALPQRSDVRLSVYDPAGRLVRTLVNGAVEPGTHYAVWDGRTESGKLAGSGVYFYRFEAPGVVETRKMVLAR
jgi:hypothetical protein